MSSEDVVIDVRNLSKRYEIYDFPRDRLKQLVLPRLHRTASATLATLGMARSSAAPRFFREFWALKEISFSVRRGETIGIIGRNGSGKSTLLQILAGTLAQTGGQFEVKGRTAALLELGSGFNPEFTGRENVFLNGRILGLSLKEIESRYDQIVEFADIEGFIDQPVKTYSSGMFVRLAFAVQAHIDASVIIVDEALAVGDVFFRQKCYAHLERLRNSGVAILLVSHSMPDIEQYCERAMLLDHGVMRFIGRSSDATKHYYLLHQTSNLAHAAQPAAPATPVGDDQRVAPNVPLPSAFTDMREKPQISNGQARCRAWALCNESGYPSNTFRQGDVGVFYCEYEIIEPIQVPVFGVVIANERGVIVHGKNSWQAAGEGPPAVVAGERLLCRQEIRLSLAPGEYTFELGLAAVTRAEWDRRHLISHEEWASFYVTVSVVTNAGHFAVGFAMRDGVPILTHHGVADLPGEIAMERLQ
jgi:lipopolysaccharide transport system ATP-binding protein